MLDFSWNLNFRILAIHCLKLLCKRFSECRVPGWWTFCWGLNVFAAWFLSAHVQKIQQRLKTKPADLELDAHWLAPAANPFNYFSNCGEKFLARDEDVCTMSFLSALKTSQKITSILSKWKIWIINRSIGSTFHSMNATIASLKVRNGPLLRQKHSLWHLHAPAHHRPRQQPICRKQFYFSGA